MKLSRLQRRMLIYLVVIMTAPALVVCSGEVTEPDPNPNPAAVATVSITPSSPAIPLGGQLQLAVTLRDADGNQLTGRSVTWSSENSSVASVDGSGLVTANAIGATDVTASSEGKQGTASITVFTGGAGTISLNPGVTYQTMMGWEATADIGILDFPASDYQRWQNNVADSAAAIGVNRLRLEVRSGMENNTDYFDQWTNGVIARPDYTLNWYRPINDNGDPFTVNPSGFQFSEVDAEIDAVVTPLQQRLAAKGEDLYVNLNFVDFSTNWSFEHRNAPEEYAEFLLVYFQHIENKYGWVPDAVEVILEPDNGGWNGTQIGQVIAAAGARLANAGYTPDFIAPSNSSMSGAINFFDQAIAVSGASQYLKEIAYHRYSGVSDDNLRQIGARAEQRGIRASMLELIGANYTHLHKDLTLARNSSWQQYVLGFPTNDNGAQYLVADFNTGNVSVGSRTRYLRQYFEFVRLGAQRIEATSQNGQLSPLAFVNTNGKYTVVVMASGGHSFDIGGLPAGTYGITYTTGSEYRRVQSDVTLSAGETLQTSIPTSGVITVYGK